MDGNITPGRLAEALTPADHLAASKRLLQKYSTDGLRTLCLAMRSLSYGAFKAWLAERERVCCPQ